MRKHIIITLSFILALFVTNINAHSLQPEFSKAGVYPMENSGRKIYNFNIGWRFIKKDVAGAEAKGFNDADWEQVNLPHGLEYLPFEASGSVNYQGPAWYRKHITIDKAMNGKRLNLYFEAIMGKSKIWVNGSLVKAHFGGFLPIVIDITDNIIPGEENIIAVFADNSDDPSYPPGKPQTTLDFTYFGGIYRDVWLVENNPVLVSDPNQVDHVAGGGVFVHYENLSKQKVDVIVATEIQNLGTKTEKLNLTTEVVRKDEQIAGNVKSSLTLEAGERKTITQTITINSPNLWSPDNPYLHNLITTLTSKKGESLDGFRKRIGIRKIDFKGKQGFYLNGEKYNGKLMGGNRHQDFAYIGNALPNNTHWRDAKKLRDAGMKIIRSAHYPQDPAFMDACDELGLFVIVATPGWQFWPKNIPVFEQRVYSDIRQMVRQYRNRPSVILWEPILNETSYPDHFAKKTHDLVHEEFPYQGAFTACDGHASGSEHFDVIYGGEGKEEERSLYTREWGDNVDDWSSHNSPSRAAREWGEKAQLIQAYHYSYPRYYQYYNYDRLYRTSDQSVGGTLWHSFDHQRGYHPDPFYGGILDAIRQPKYAYYFFQSQQGPEPKLEKSESGPMVYIAHEMSPFSEPDVLVFSNCEQVRLIFCEKDTFLLKADHDKYKMPHPYFLFEDAYHFMTVKGLHRARKFEQSSLVAEALKDGKVVARHKKMPAKRIDHLILSVDNENVPLIADGSDVVPVIASVCDKDGNVKRLNNRFIKFEIEGEGNIVGNGMTGINPVKVGWGTAPILIKSSNKPGDISIKAHLVYEGANQPLGAELIIKSMPLKDESLQNEIPVLQQHVSEAKNKVSDDALQKKIRQLEKKLIEKGLQEVEKQQESFDTSKKR